jgi:DNA-binding MarR family transcriptional regulator
MDRLVDIDALRVADGNGMRTPARRPPPRPRQRERFLKGPIPWPWLERAGALPGKALHVAIRLWHEVGLTRTSKVSISMTGMARMGISRFAASRGLSALEAAGLVSVVRHAGRKPQVLMVATPAQTAAATAAGTGTTIANSVETGSDEKMPMPPCEPAPSGD